MLITVFKIRSNAGLDIYCYKNTVNNIINKTLLTISFNLLI